MAIFTVGVDTTIEVEADTLEDAQEFVDGWTDYDFFLGADFVEEEKVRGYIASVMY